MTWFVCPSCKKGYNSETKLACPFCGRITGTKGTRSEPYVI